MAAHLKKLGINGFVVKPSDKIMCTAFAYGRDPYEYDWDNSVYVDGDAELVRMPCARPQPIMSFYVQEVVSKRHA